MNVNDFGVAKFDSSGRVKTTNIMATTSIYGNINDLEFSIQNVDTVNITG